MAPQIPVLQQPNVLRKWSEIAVLSLGGNECRDHVGHLRNQARIIGHPQGLNGGNEIFAEEFSRPRHELRYWLAIAQAEHLDHARVRLGRAQQPVVLVGFDALADWTREFEMRARERIELQRTLVRQKLCQRARCDRPGSQRQP